MSSEFGTRAMDTMYNVDKHYFPVEAVSLSPLHLVLEPMLFAPRVMVHALYSDLEAFRHA